MAVTTGRAGTVAVEAVKVLSMLKPPRWVGKWFRDRLEGAPKKKVKIPAGLKTRPTWQRRDCLGACPAVGRVDVDCQAGRPRPYRP
jgi:hypothetical protein